MSHSLGYGTSSGGLNTGGNLSESSFLEALFGLEFGHADFADDADFSSLLFVCPTDFCPMRAGISQMMQMTQIFFAAHSKNQGGLHSPMLSTFHSSRHYAQQETC